MSTLAAFFRGSDTEFGIFYPKGYLIAVFPDLLTAKRAQERLRIAGFRDEAIAASGDDVLRNAEDHVREGGLWAYLLREFSRFLATEEVYEDRDLKLAAEGAGFVVVHCPTLASQNRAWRVLQRLKPLAARHYALGGIEHLAGDR